MAEQRGKQLWNDGGSNVAKHLREFPLSVRYETKKTTKAWQAICSEQVCEITQLWQGRILKRTG